MAKATDIALFQDDLFISDGDLVISYSDDQHIKDSITAYPGWWKEHPFDGVGIMLFQNAKGIEQELARKIDLELTQDGYQSSNARVSFDAEGKLQIEPNAVRQ